MLRRDRLIGAAYNTAHAWHCRDKAVCLQFSQGTADGVPYDAELPAQYGLGRKARGWSVIACINASSQRIGDLRVRAP